MLHYFQFTGLEEPKVMNLQMCQFITNSCCTVSDQNTIYALWVAEGMEKKLTDRLDYYKHIYQRLLSNSEHANELVTKVMENLKQKRISNCKLLGKQILSFDVKKIGGKLNEAISQMYEFFYQSYKSFFC